MYKHYNFMVKWTKKASFQGITNLYKFVDTKENFKYFFCPTIDKQKLDTTMLNNNANNIDNQSLDNLKNADETKIKSIYNKYYCY